LLDGWRTEVDALPENPADLNHAIGTTLLVASNEYQYVAAVGTEFAELPAVVCNIGELNQVLLNLIVNAAHAIHQAGTETFLERMRNFGPGILQERVRVMAAPTWP